jgi:hypothetical protein
MSTLGDTIDVFSPAYRRLRDDARIIVQKVYLLLNTEPGTYSDDPEYGFDLESQLGSESTPEGRARFAANMASAIEDLDGIASASVTASETVSGAAVRGRFTAVVTPIDGDALDLALAVSEQTIDVLLRSQ